MAIAGPDPWFPSVRWTVVGLGSLHPDQQTYPVATLSAALAEFDPAAIVTDWVLLLNRDLLTTSVHEPVASRLTVHCPDPFVTHEVDVPGPEKLHKAFASARPPHPVTVTWHVAVAIGHCEASRLGSRIETVKGETNGVAQGFP
jgi:hypothetical protein